MTTTKAHLTQQVAEASGFTQLDCGIVIEMFMEQITFHLRQRRKITLRRFGAFYHKVREPKPARNPRTGERIDLPKRNTALWQVGDTLKKAVKENRISQAEDIALLNSRAAKWMLPSD